MEIQEVSEILGLCHFLKAPKHVFITEEPVQSRSNGITHYRGLQPKIKGDSIFLTQHADETTPVHEAIHAMGFGEPVTQLLTRIVTRKNQVMENLPLVKESIQKKLVYEQVFSSTEYPDAHSDKFQGRVKHFILVQH